MWRRWAAPHWWRRSVRAATAPLSSARPPAKAGRVRGLALASSSRSDIARRPRRLVAQRGVSAVLDQDAAFRAARASGSWSLVAISFWRSPGELVSTRGTGGWGASKRPGWVACRAASCGVLHVELREPVVIEKGPCTGQSIRRSTPLLPAKSPHMPRPTPPPQCLATRQVAISATADIRAN